MERWVYFIRRADGEGPVKIGCSSTPEARLVALMSWSPYPLNVVATLPGNHQVERRFHHLFEDLHSHHEWFAPSPRIDLVIKAIVEGRFDVSALPEPKVLGRTAYKAYQKTLPGSCAVPEIVRVEAMLRDACIDIPAALNEAGINASTWWRWRAGKSDPRTGLVRKVEAVARRLISEKRAA